MVQQYRVSKSVCRAVSLWPAWCPGSWVGVGRVRRWGWPGGWASKELAARASGQGTHAGALGPAGLPGPWGIGLLGEMSSMFLPWDTCQATWAPLSCVGRSGGREGSWSVKLLIPPLLLLSSVHLEALHWPPRNTQLWIENLCFFHIEKWY